MCAETEKPAPEPTPEPVPTPAPKPLLAAFVADLMLAARIEDAAGRLGYGVDWIERQADLEGQPAESVREMAGRELGEPLLGPRGALVERLSRLRPALILFDLGNREIPWREWLTLITSVPATRRIPVVCFGPHVETEALETAKKLGARAALPRSRFMKDIQGVIQQYAQPVDEAALQTACQGALSENGRRGLELFNQGEYFEAHEALEAAWNEDDSPGRDLYRGILQVAVAYLHIRRGNYRGAMKLFLRMRQWLDPLPEQCRGVEIDQLREDVGRVYEQLKTLGPDRMDEIKSIPFEKVKYSL